MPDDFFTAHNAAGFQSVTTGSGLRGKVAVGLIFTFSNYFGKARGKTYQNCSSYPCEALCCSLEPL